MYEKTHELLTSVSTLHTNSDIKLPLKDFKNAIFYYAICINYLNINKLFELINKYISELNIDNNIVVTNNLHTTIYQKKRVRI